jgi:homoserine kinase
LADPFAEPRRAPLIRGFDAVKATALAHGALGSSISGAGPAVFALFTDRETAEDAAQAMAKAFGAGALSHVGAIAKAGASCRVIS